MPLESGTMLFLDDDTVSKLSDNSITDLKALQDATKTVKGRTELAEKMKMPLHKMDTLAKQADLCHVSPNWNVEINKLSWIDINSLEDLRGTSVSALLDHPDFEKSGIYVTDLRKYMEFAVTTDTGFEERTPKKLATTMPFDIKDSPILGLLEIVLQLGEDIRTIQEKLDQYAAETERAILKNRELSDRMVSVNWYMMPEIEFSIKMEYTTYRDEEKEGQASSERIKLIPSGFLSIDL